MDVSSEEVLYSKGEKTRLNNHKEGGYLTSCQVQVKTQTQPYVEFKKRGGNHSKLFFFFLEGGEHRQRDKKLDQQVTEFLH